MGGVFLAVDVEGGADAQCGFGTGHRLRGGGRCGLRPSWRRKVISVVQGGVLTGLLAPIITPPFSTIVAALALIVLVYSFAQDVVWLVRGPMPDRLF